MSGSSAQSGGLKDDPWMMDASDRLTETRVLHKPLANDREMEPAPVESPGNKQHFARKADDAGHRYEPALPSLVSYTAVYFPFLVVSAADL
jgi:hypothetical protein